MDIVMSWKFYPQQHYSSVTENKPEEVSVWQLQVHRFKEKCPRGVMVKAMYWGIVVSEFEFQSHYYVHFRTNTLK